MPVSTSETLKTWPDSLAGSVSSMDQDGANSRALTNSNDIVLTPRFSPNRQEITYMSFENQQPRVYLLQLETGQREVVGNFPGMFGYNLNSGPAYDKDIYVHEARAGLRYSFGNNCEAAYVPPAEPIVYK